ncbi:MAG: MotA/TolQ/ExbB proton channel family protein [Candidatus Sericytochromatia bacterium]|nr:MotA/TolQ/ExbB proton channel family protein [Candidatus Sericytochromatia bacterium]
MSIIIGIIGGFLSLVGGIYITEGSHFNIFAYWDLSAFVIVVVGTLFASMAMYSMIDIIMIPIFFLQCILPLPYKEGDIVDSFQRMADKVKGSGIPSLTSEIPSAFDDYMRRGVKLVISGTDSHAIKEIMHDEIEKMNKRHKQKLGIFNEMAGVSPTMGMIGTILALVLVLGNLEDTSKLGSSIAVALIATLYGVAVANLFFVPVAKKLDVKNEREILMKQMILEGLLAVQAGESSFLVGQRLKACVSEGLRSRIEGGKGSSKKKNDKHIEIATYMNAIDQEKAMAFLAEVKKSLETRDLGQDDAKNMLGELINEAEDKVIMKDFANEFMKSKASKKLPKGLKRKSAKKSKKSKRKAAVADDDE